MKKTISTAITLLAFFMANAQIQKGATALGFNLAAIYNVNKFSNSMNASYSQTITNKGFALQPFYEYFVSKNLSFGIALNYSNNFINNNTNFNPNTSYSEFNLKAYGLQVQFKKYWFATKKVAFTFTPAIAALYNDNFYENGSSNASKNISSDSYWQFGVGGNLGAAYFIKKNVMVEGQTNFFSYSYRPEVNQNSSSNNLTISVIPTNLTLGFKFVFGNNANNVKVD